MKLPNRMKILVSIVQELQGLISDENIHQYLFLYSYKYACNNVYDFIFVDNKPYCITLYEDKKLLINKQILQNSLNWQASPDTPRFAKMLDMIEKFSLQKLKNEIENGLITDEVVLENYNNYFKPFDIAENEITLYTIGYEGLNLEQYLNKLLKYKINCLCDVRRNPYSQKYGFSKTEFSKALELVNIPYIHIPELGISSSLRHDLKQDADYYQLLKLYETDILPNQGSGIKLLEDLLFKNKKIAITCFEAKLSHCHRSKIANFMDKNNSGRYKVKNI